MRNNQDRLGKAAQGAPPTPASPNMGFVVPTEFVELPSRGKFYSSEHPLHNQETIEIKFMTAREEDILASSTLFEKGLAIERLLQNIVVPELDTATLLIGDRNAIMIAARASAYGNHYFAQVTCSECLTKQEYDFDLNKISYNLDCFNPELLEERKIIFNEEEGLFEYTLPKSGVKVGISLLTGAEETKPESEKDDESAVTKSLLRFIASVNGNKESEYISQFVNSMLAWDSKELRAVLPTIVPNIDLRQEFDCGYCANKETMEVPLTAAFFWPR